MIKKNIFIKNASFVLALALINVCNISTMYASYADVDMLEEDSSSNVGEWQIEGDFSKLFYHGSGAALNREFYARPKEPQEFIENINVTGYNNENIYIYVTLKKENLDLFETLRIKNLITLPQILKNKFCSNNKKPLKEFLDVFIEKNLIPASLSQHILKKIETEKPDAAELEEYLTQVSKKDAYEAELKLRIFQDEERSTSTSRAFPFCSAIFKKLAEIATEQAEWKPKELILKSTSANQPEVDLNPPHNSISIKDPRHVGQKSERTNDDEDKLVKKQKTMP